MLCILGELLLLIRLPLLTCSFFTKISFKDMLCIYISYSIFIVVWFLVYEFVINKNCILKLSKSAIKYSIVFIIAILFDLIINIDNAINQLVVLIEDMLFLGLDFIIIVSLLKYKGSIKKGKETNN